jgi:hypothetical protein
VWDAQSGQELFALKGAPALAVAFSPDGKRLVSRAGPVRVWDAQTGEQLLPAKDKLGAMLSASSTAVSPDGKRLALATSDHLKLWDMQTGQELLSVPMPGDIAGVIAFSPDGNRLGHVTTGGTVTIWDATPLPQKPAAEQTRKFSYVDLQPRANQKLKDNFAGDDGNSLASLPTGEQTFEKVKFKIADGLLQLGSTLWKEEKPERKKPDRVEGIAVGKAFARLHLLHATQYGSLYGVIADDTEIAQYVVHYEGGDTETIPVVYGKDVRNWWFSPNEKGVTRGKVAWKGENEATKKTQDRPEAQRRQIRLYLSSWENPHPTKKVVSIDFVKVGDSAAAPFCVAMTLEEK